VGNGLCTTLNYLLSVAGNGRAQRSSTHNKRRCGQRPGHRDKLTQPCDAQRAPPWATAWAPKSSTCDAQRAAPGATAGRSDQVRTTSAAAGNDLGTAMN
jgi:hypothetical protein